MEYSKHEELTRLPGFFKVNTVLEDGNVVKVQWLYRYPNDYGASVITGLGSYTDKEHPYELAVLFFYGPDDGEFILSRGNPVTSDVMPCLSADDVARTLKQIEELSCTK